jgi:site-specific DNA-methyltransferase (adenine-specific)
MFVFSKGKPRCYNPIKDKPTVSPNRKLDKRHGRTKNGEKRKKANGELINKKFQDRFNIWHYNTGNNLTTKDKIAFNHPAIFSEQLVVDHIISWSNEGDLIYDPLAGSGTVPKIAMITKRPYIASEISTEYCKIIEERIQISKNLFTQL